MRAIIGAVVAYVVTGWLIIRWLYHDYDVKVTRGKSQKNQ